MKNKQVDHLFNDEYNLGVRNKEVYKYNKKLLKIFIKNNNKNKILKNNEIKLLLKLIKTLKIQKYQMKFYSKFLKIFTQD